MERGAGASSVAGSGGGSSDRDSAVKYEQWRERMREKYGLDTSRYTQPPPGRPAPPPDSPRDSASASASGAPSPPTAASRSTCVMV
jgi:hypothetical protein